MNKPHIKSEETQLASVEASSHVSDLQDAVDCIVNAAEHVKILYQNVSGEDAPPETQRATLTTVGQVMNDLPNQLREFSDQIHNHLRGIEEMIL